MTTTLLEKCESASLFQRRADLPTNGEPGTGLGNSPRRSDHDTAVVLAPEHYELLLDIRDAAMKLRQAVKAAGFEIMQTSGDWSIIDVSELGKAEEARTLQVIERNQDLTTLLDAVRAEMIPLLRLMVECKPPYAMMLTRSKGKHTSLVLKGLPGKRAAALLELLNQGAPDK